MKNKTCGECKHYDFAGQCNYVYEFNNVHVTDKACSFFEPIPKLTNGEKIMQGGNKALLEYYNTHECDICAYYNTGKCNETCCENGKQVWLDQEAE